MLLYHIAWGRQKSFQSQATYRQLKCPGNPSRVPTKLALMGRLMPQIWTQSPSSLAGSSSCSLGCAPSSSFSGIGVTGEANNKSKVGDTPVEVIGLLWCSGDESAHRVALELILCFILKSNLPSSGLSARSACSTTSLPCSDEARNRRSQGWLPLLLPPLPPAPPCLLLPPHGGSPG